MADLTAAKAGDRVLFEKGDGFYDIEDVTAPGQFHSARRGLKSLHEARDIAVGHMDAGGHLWVRHHATLHSIEPYRAPDVAKNPTTARTAPPSFGKTGT
jgi:hypothetical protein